MLRTTALGLMAGLALTSLTAKPAAADADPYIADIMMVGFNFCPRGWAALDSQLLAIASNTALFSLIGTTFGGDGRTTFGLPDMRGRSPVHIGRGPGLSTYTWGERGGINNRQLNLLNLPSHNHVATNSVAAHLNASSSAVSNGSPGGNALGTTGAPSYVRGGTPDVTMAVGSAAMSISTTISNAGGSQPFSIMQPFEVVKFCIAEVGVYPSRN